MTLKRLGKNITYGTVRSREFGRALLAGKDEEVRWFGFGRLIIVWDGKSEG